MHKNSWQHSICENTKYFHDDSKKIDYDPSCKPPRKTTLNDYDGLMHVDMGKISMLVGFNKLEKGIEIDFNGNNLFCEGYRGKHFEFNVPKNLIPPALKFFKLCGWIIPEPFRMI